MPLKFSKLTRANMRKLVPGKSLSEHGIVFRRKQNGDGHFSINLMVDGQRIHRAFGRESEGVTRQQVEDFIEKAKTDAREGRFQLPTKKKFSLNFDVAADEYLEKLAATNGKDLKSKTYRLHHHLRPFFKNKTLITITHLDVERYKRARKDEGAAVATINRELAILSHIFSKAVEWQWLVNKPCQVRKFKEESTRITYLTETQIESLLAAAKQDQSPHIYTFILVGLQTSMRLNEILSISIENIDLARQVIFIPKAKAGAREQPMTSSLANFLEKKIAELGSGAKWLFPSSLSSTGYLVNIQKAFKRTVAAAGLDPKFVVRHTLRHTAITHLVQAGVDLPTVQRISGHKTLSMVLRYSHQNGAHIQAAMNKLEKKYRAPQSA